ncbi:MAG: efflux RND transporter periplasmic adaptor subunit, partial [Verrucomicrobia bacterium]|nr:efflux RND transporter periplasmic adaptor subunit [Verrucomicrobiota bacterium]
RILITDKEAFRPGMSVTSEIETRYRTNALSVPIQSVTTRLKVQATNTTADVKPPTVSEDSSKSKSTESLIEEVVFVVNGDRVEKRLVKRGISDDNYTEILEGLQEGEEIVSGGYKAISKDLEDGKLILVKP